MDSFFVNRRPTLTEPGVKHYIGESLKRCNKVRMQFENYVFNIGMLLFFVILTGGILLWKYKGKLTPAQKYEKDKEKQEYILSKIQKFELAKKQAHQELITGLPHWEKEVNDINTKIIY